MIERPAAHLRRSTSSQVELQRNRGGVAILGSTGRIKPPTGTATVWLSPPGQLVHCPSIEAHGDRMR